LAISCWRANVQSKLTDSQRAVVWERTGQIISDHWPAIERLAQELHRAGRLDERQILDLLQRPGLARRGRAAA
jgi:hypothetical protein